MNQLLDYCKDYESLFCTKIEISNDNINDFITKYPAFLRYSDYYLNLKCNPTQKLKLLQLYGSADNFYIKSCDTLKRRPLISGSYLLEEYNII